MATVQVESTFSFKFRMGLRGYHHYQHTENWKPFRGQRVYLQRELDNEADRLAVTGSVISWERYATVGHVPHELSRYIWHALQRKCEFTVSVTNPHHRRSPLMQGGLKIEIEVNGHWGDEESMNKLKQYITSSSYPNDGQDYPDDSKDILKEICGEEKNILPEVTDDDIVSSDSDIEEHSSKGKKNITH